MKIKLESFLLEKDSLVTGCQPVILIVRNKLLFLVAVSGLESGDRMSARAQKANSDYTGIASHDSMTLVMTGRINACHSLIAGVATEALEDEAKYLLLVVHGKV